MYTTVRSKVERVLYLEVGLQYFADVLVDEVRFVVLQFFEYFHS